MDSYEQNVQEYDIFVQLMVFGESGSVTAKCAIGPASL